MEALEANKKKKKVLNNNPNNNNNDDIMIKDDSTQPTVYRKGIGKYISPKTIKGAQAAPDPPSSSLAG